MEARTALDALVGEWTLSARDPGGEPWPGNGRATFEWHDSGAFLLQRTTIDVPEAPDSIAIVGCDDANGTYSQLYSDERGVHRVYSMTMSDTAWTLEREGEPFPQRFMATFSDDRQIIEGRWEKAEDGTNFSVDFYLTYRRISSPGSS